jgi:hypothetical protein
MRVLGLIIVVLCLIGTARAEPFIAPLVPGALCRAAIATTERASTLPPQLLAAIARVESGRRDPVSGKMAPWPWTINAEGQGTYYDTKAQAIAAAQALQARGVRSFDVGCMQINMMHHPHAFASLEQAFDPSANAAYAVRFLTELHTQTNDWPRAAGLYHSATPELGAAYQAQVATAWTEERRVASSGTLPSAQPWTPTPGGMPAAGGLRFAGGVPATIPHLAAGIGRDLAAYRSAPVLYAVRAPVAIGRN